MSRTGFMGGSVLKDFSCKGFLNKSRGYPFVQKSYCEGQPLRFLGQ